MRSLAIIGVGVILSCLAGCSSIVVRLGDNRTALHDPIRGVYPAVKRDIKMADHSHAGHGILMGKSSPFCAFLYYLDMPISIVTDTIGLPFDLIRQEDEEAQQSQEGYSE